MNTFILKKQSLLESAKDCLSFCDGLCPRNLLWRTLIHTEIPLPLNSLNNHTVTEPTLDATKYVSKYCWQLEMSGSCITLISLVKG